MGTKITKSNVRSAIRDDKAHMDYLKRDVRDDQRAGGRYKDINQTADEKHISKLAGDVKADGHFLSKHWNHSSPLNQIGPLEVEKGGGIDYVGNQANQTALEQSYMDQVPNDNRSTRKTNDEINNDPEPDPENEITVGDSPETMIKKGEGEVPVTTGEGEVPVTTGEGEDPSGDKPELDENGNPVKFVDIAEGEVDGVAYGAADVDGHIAIDTSTVGYDDTMNLP